MLMLHENESTTAKTIKTRLASEHGEYSWSTSVIGEQLKKYANEGSIILSVAGKADLPKVIVKEKTAKVEEPIKAPKAIAEADEPKLVTSKLVPGETVDTAKVKTLRTKGMTPISRVKAMEMMENNKGRFFSAEFISKKNKTRVINCQYLPNQGESKLGYVKVREASKMRIKASNNIRQVNMQTIKYLRLGGTTYKVG